jgi:predicted DNA-binding WGR domain protein
MPDEHWLIRHALVLHRGDPDCGVARFYSLTVERDLFGTIQLVRNWGRVGTNSQEPVDVFAIELDASAAIGIYESRKGVKMALPRPAPADPTSKYVLEYRYRGFTLVSAGRFPPPAASAHL